MLILIIMDLDNVLRIDSPILIILSTFKREKGKVGEVKAHVSYDHNKRIIPEVFKDTITDNLVKVFLIPFDY